MTLKELHQLTRKKQVVPHLSGYDASTTCAAAQDKGEFADLREACWDNPPYVSRAWRQDRWQHQYGHRKLGGNKWRGTEGGAN